MAVLAVYFKEKHQVLLDVWTLKRLSDSDDSGLPERFFSIHDLFHKR
jgi:hypothetical protein